MSAINMTVTHKSCIKPKGPAQGVTEGLEITQWHEVGKRLSNAYEVARGTDISSEATDINQWYGVCQKLATRELWTLTSDEDNEPECEELHIAEWKGLGSRLASLQFWDFQSDSYSDVGSEGEESDWELESVSSTVSTEAESEDASVTQWEDISSRLASSRIWDLESDVDSSSDSESVYLKTSSEQQSTSAGDTSDWEVNNFNGPDVPSTVVLTVLTLVTSMQDAMRTSKTCAPTTETLTMSDHSLTDKCSSVSEVATVEEVDVALWGDICTRMSSPKIWEVSSASDSDSDYQKDPMDQDSTSAGETSDWEVESLSGTSSL